MPDKSALCSEMTDSAHKESTRDVVYLEVCKVFDAVSWYFFAKLEGRVDCKMGGKLPGLPGSKSGCQYLKV